VDNLPPATPSVFTGVFGSGAASLHWGVNTAPDLAGFRLYRGSTAAFAPDPGNLIATTPDTGYVDHVATALFYKLSAYDHNGNESGFAATHPGDVSDVEGGELQRVLRLGRPVPNPARSEVRVSYGLPSGAVRRLEVIDVEGRIVRRIAAGPIAAGRHRATWDLRDSRGRPVESGLYFVRLAVGPEVRTVRLIVVR
jgi:hypothetical protein